MKTLSNHFEVGIAACVRNPNDDNEWLVYYSGPCTWHDDPEITHDFPNGVNAVTFNVNTETCEEALGIEGRCRRVENWRAFHSAMMQHCWTPVI